MRRNFYFCMLLGAFFMLSGCERDEAFKTPPSNLRSITYFRLQPYHNEGRIPTTFNGSINETEKTITLRVPSTLDLTALRPEVLITPWATVSPPSLDPVDFSGPEPVEYTVTAESGMSSVYQIIIDPTHQFAGVVQYGVWVNNVTDPTTGMPCRTTFNSQAGRIWDVRVPAGTDVSALELEFEPDNTAYNCVIEVGGSGEDGPFDPFKNGGSVDFTTNPEERLWFRFTSENGNTTTVYQLTISYIEY